MGYAAVAPRADRIDALVIYDIYYPPLPGQGGMVRDWYKEDRSWTWIGQNWILNSRNFISVKL